MNFKGFLLAVSSVLVLGLTSPSSFADKINAKVASTKSSSAKAATPYVVVEGLTEGMMSVIRKDGALFKKDPNAYFAKIQEKLEPSVGFRLIAKNVMGKYGKVATKEQRDRFVTVFTRSLVETLGKGMSSYSDLKVVTLPFDSSKGDLSVLRKVEVVQQIEAVDGATHVSYTMAKNKAGQWKMVNVILNGINLGKQFRNQFKQAMKQSSNDIDKVVSNWAKPA